MTSSPHLTKNSLERKTHKLEGKQLLTLLVKWYEQGLPIPNPENAYRQNPAGFLPYQLEGRGDKVLALIKKSKTKHRDQIIETIVKIANLPLDLRNGGQFGNWNVGAYNQWLRLIKKEIHQNDTK